MEFIIIPKEIFDLAPIEKLKKMDIEEPRTSLDGSQVILHIEHYKAIEEFPSPTMMTAGEIETIQYPYPVYQNPSDEFSTLLNSDEWTSKEETNILEQ